MCSRTMQLLRLCTKCSKNFQISARETCQAINDRRQDSREQLTQCYPTLARCGVILGAIFVELGTTVAKILHFSTVLLTRNQCEALFLVDFRI